MPNAQSKLAILTLNTKIAGYLHKVLVKRLFRKLKALRERGVLLSARILADRLALHGLRRVYGFHPWHAEAPLSARPYRLTLAEMINQLVPQCVVEVGCGLGVALALIDAPQRWGYDIDLGAIRAARFLRDKSIHFIEGGLTEVSQDPIDVLILVNWIHDFSPEQLDTWLSPLLPRTRHLVLDAIDPDNTLDYRYMHDYTFLAGRATRLVSVRPASEGRQFHLYQVIR